MTNSYKSKKTKTIEQIPCFLKDGSKREDPTKKRSKDGFCVTKKCNSSNILNPETGECISKSSKKGKKLSSIDDIDKLFSDKSLKEIQDNRYKQSKPKRKKNTGPSSSVMRKPCRDGQIRNPETGRCNFIKKNIIPDVKPNPEPEEPKIEEPKIEEPKIEEPKTEEPEIEKPKTEEPEIEEPKTEELENLKINKLQDQIDQIFNSISEIKNNLIISRGFSDSKVEEIKNEIRNIKTTELPLDSERDNLDSLKVMIDTKLSEIQKENNKVIENLEKKIQDSLLSLEKSVPHDTNETNIESLKKIIEENMTFMSNLLTIQSDNKNNNNEIEIKMTKLISDIKTQNTDKLKVLETLISNMERRLEKIGNEEKNSRIISNIKPRELKININNNNGLGDSSLNNLFVLSKKDMINNHLMEDQEVPEIIRGIKFSTN